MLTRIGIVSLVVMLVLLAYFLSQATSKQTHWLDIDNDDITERFDLGSGQLQIWKENQLIFTSDITYNVTHYAYGDANNDGKAELLLGFWRRGDYGIDNDFARKRRDPAASYHLYLYKYQNEAQMFRLIWGSSTLNDPLYDFNLVEAGTDNTILRVRTGSYEDYDRNGKIIPLDSSDWVWDQWYFKEI